MKIQHTVGHLANEVNTPSNESSSGQLEKSALLSNPNMYNVLWCGGPEQSYECKDIWPDIQTHVMAMHQSEASLALG